MHERTNSGKSLIENVRSFLDKLVEKCVRRVDSAHHPDHDSESRAQSDLTDREFLEQAYQTLFGRDIDQAGYEHFSGALREGHSRSSILLALANSEEFAERRAFMNRFTEGTRNPVRRDQQSVQAAVPIDDSENFRCRYDEIWREFHGRDADSYFLIHRQRYYELFAALNLHFANKPPPRILEIGPSAFLPFYRTFFPNVHLVTLDRPTNMDGATESFFQSRTSIESHYQADLTSVRLSPRFGTPPIGTFDVVVCTEVLEHLLVYPVDFLHDLMSLLTDNGVLYLTTPNFFSYKNLQAIEMGENPQHVFPGGDRNIDGHHHVREYGMKELQRFAGLAGGEIVAAGFSDCWDTKSERDTVLLDHPEWRGNLVLLLKRSS